MGQRPIDMSRALFSIAALVASSALAFVACGGAAAPTTPAGTAEPVAPDAGDDWASAVHPDDLAALDASAGEDAQASSTGGDPGPGSTVVAGEEDACTPVGIELEKAARPKIKDCYGEAKKKEPNLQGAVRIKVEVAITGKVKSIKIVERTLPQKPAQCMLEVIKQMPLSAADAEKCRGLSIVIPVAFPTPR